MTRTLRTHARVLTLLAAVFVLPGQMTAPPMGTFKDLETWTRDAGNVPDNELGLNLQLDGPEATLLVTVSGIRLRRDPRSPAREVIVTAKPGAKLNTSRTLAPSMVFVGTSKDKKLTTVNLTDRVTSYPPGPFVPGDTYLVSLRATMKPDEFLQIMGAETVRATMLGIEVTLRPDQLKALRALGDKLGFIAR